MAVQDHTAQTAAYLRMLLVRPGEPRAVWQKHAPDAAPGRIDAAAAAEVLAGRLDGPSAPELVPAVRRALDGTALDEATLDLFIDAFEITPRHAQRLRSLMSGSDLVRVITGAVLPAPELFERSSPPGYDTLALHELHTLGPDGLPAEHQTIQAIKSTVDQLESYPYRFDTDELVVEVIRGGRLGERVYRLGEELFGVDILLDPPLARDETALMHYRTTFLYRRPPRPEFRRGVLHPTHDVTIWVRFHPDRLPARVWAARWDRLDHAHVVDEQEVELDGEFSVHSRFDVVEQAIVGFHWAWD
ncbi:MAG: hypothetical protein ACM30G_16105 [Micromonosporaceae bacterium]